MFLFTRTKSVPRRGNNAEPQRQEKEIDQELVGPEKVCRTQKSNKVSISETTFFIPEHGEHAIEYKEAVDTH